MGVLGHPPKIFSFKSNEFYPRPQILKISRLQVHPIAPTPIITQISNQRRKFSNLEIKTQNEFMF